MGLESPTYVNDLVAANPVSSDEVSQGDDHIRNMKSALKATFPNADKPFYFPNGEEVTAAELLVAADQNKVVGVDATAGDIDVELPAGLAAGDAGWEVTIVKISNDTNVVSVSVDGLAAEINNSTYINMLNQWDWVRVIWTGEKFIGFSSQMGAPRGSVTFWPHAGARSLIASPFTFSNWSAIPIPSGWVACIQAGTLSTQTVLSNTSIHADLRQMLIDAGYPYGQSGSDPKLPTISREEIASDATYIYYGSHIMKD